METMCPHCNQKFDIVSEQTFVIEGKDFLNQLNAQDRDHSELPRFAEDKKMQDLILALRKKKETSSKVLISEDPNQLQKAADDTEDFDYDFELPEVTCDHHPEERMREELAELYEMWKNSTSCLKLSSQELKWYIDESVESFHLTKGISRFESRTLRIFLTPFSLLKIRSKIILLEIFRFLKCTYHNPSDIRNYYWYAKIGNSSFINQYYKGN